MKERWFPRLAKRSEIAECPFCGYSTVKSEIKKHYFKSSPVEIHFRNGKLVSKEDSSQTNEKPSEQSSLFSLQRRRLYLIE